MITAISIIMFTIGILLIVDAVKRTKEVNDLTSRLQSLNESVESYSSGMSEVVKALEELSEELELSEAE